MIRIEREYVKSYNRHEGIFIVVFLIIAIGLIVLGFTLPV
jgi:regulatory protein YycI of two-component signal transduction system YycFG